MSPRVTTERVRDLLAPVGDTNWRRQTAACTHVDQDEHVAIKAGGALIIDCMADDGYAAMVCAAPDLALDLLDARDRLAAVERERDELRAAAVDLLAALDAHEDETDGAHYDPGCEDAVYEAKSGLRDALTGTTS